MRVGNQKEREEGKKKEGKVTNLTNSLLCTNLKSSYTLRTTLPSISSVMLSSQLHHLGAGPN
jgi:DNA-binding HxlR family transcriptional regulator